MNKWDKRFLDLAHHVAQWSEDESTKVGCILTDKDYRIISIGYNGLPRRISTLPLERHDRFGGGKYLWFEHAERNAIYAAASAGRSTSEAKMYLTWFPCPDCARAIIQSGITSLFALAPQFDHPKWGDGFKISMAMLEEAGIIVQFFNHGT